MANTVSALNTVSGRVGRVPATYLTSPAFSKVLVEVPEGTKDYDPLFWKPTDADTHRAKPTYKRKAARTEAPKTEEVVEEELTSDSEIG